MTSNKVALTGRVRTYLETPEKGTLPVSCTVYKYDNNIFNILKYLSIALRNGAGIKVILDRFKSTSKQSKKFYFYIPLDYPDIKSLSVEQKEYLLTEEEVNKYKNEVIKVYDSMEESFEDCLSIQDSWNDFVYLLLTSDEPVLLDLSKLRPKGVTNKVGLTSSGAISFLSIYEAILNHVNQGDLLSFMQMCGQLNEVLRRGGCVTSDTWINTDLGKKQVKNLIGKKFNAVVEGNSYPSSEEGFFSSGIKDVYRVEVTDFFIVKVSNNHMFLSKKGCSQEWKELKSLQINDKILMSYGDYDSTFSNVSEIKSIDLIGKEETYDCTIEDVHEFDGNGFRLHNSYKNGIITFGLDYKHPDIIKYLNIDLKDLPGSAKKSIRLDEEVLLSNRLMRLIEVRVNDKSLMLEKKVFKILNKHLNQTELLIGKTVDTTGYVILEELFSNVCLAGDTLVLTKTGSFKIKDLVGKEVEIWDGESWFKVNNFALTGVGKLLYKVTLYDGRTISATANHTFILEDESRVKLKDLNVGHMLKEHNQNTEDMTKVKLLSKTVKFKHKKNEIISIKPSYTEDVYCCTVESTNSFGLSNGIQVGNCEEILQAHTSTCLLGHVNLGQIEYFEKIPDAICEITSLIIDLWKTWKLDAGYKASQYLSAELDKQIGIGVIGLANLLGIFEIKYIDFVEALEAYSSNSNYVGNDSAYLLAHYLSYGYEQAASLGREAGLERMFTIAPTQSCAYNHKDIEGNVTCKNINPPLDRQVRRTSHTVESMSGLYFHGDYVETMQDMINESGVEIVQRLWEAWQTMINHTGMAHSMSFDLYRKIDQDWLTRFMAESPLVTTYYQVYDRVNQSYLNKSRANIAQSECAIDNPEGCISCAE